MRRNPGLLAAFMALLLVGAGCGMSVAQHAGTGPTEGGFDIQFIDMMVPHHQGAVAMAEIAQQRGERAEIRLMADAIVGAQQGEIAQLKRWRRDWAGSDQTPPPERMPVLPGMAAHGGHGGSTMNMAAEAEQLRDTREPFDHAFIDAMIPHHQSAVDAATLAVSRAERPEIKQLATAIIADQQREIAQMERWRDAWYGPHSH